MLKRKVLGLLVSLLLLTSSFATASFRPLQGRLEKVGGQFEIIEIEQKPDQNFRIVFQSIPKSAERQSLVLHSDHVHAAMKLGMILRLSAEVLADKDGELEVTQVLLFLPTAQSVTPVWLLSNKHPTFGFKGARWLDMHAPQSDFQIL